MDENNISSAADYTFTQATTKRIYLVVCDGHSDLSVPLKHLLEETYKVCFFLSFVYMNLYF